MEENNQNNENLRQNQSNIAHKPEDEPFVSHVQEDPIMAEVNRKRQFGPKLTENHKEIAKLLRKAVPVTDLAEKFDVHRETMTAYIKANDDLKKAHESGIEALSDKYEARLHELAFREQEMGTTDNGDVFGRYDGRVMATNFNAVKFWLERRASKRGWGAKLETKETGFGNRVPIIFAGEMTVEAIAAAEAKVRAANEGARDPVEEEERGGTI